MRQSNCVMKNGQTTRGDIDMNEKQFLKLTYQAQQLLKEIQDAIEDGDDSKVTYNMEGLSPVIVTLQRMWRGEQVK
jgi:hypothetical protein